MTRQPDYEHLETAEGRPREDAPVKRLGRLILALPYPLWRRLPGWVKDIGWLHGQERVR